MEMVFPETEIPVPAWKRVTVPPPFDKVSSLLVWLIVCSSFVVERSPLLEMVFPETEIPVPAWYMVMVPPPFDRVNWLPLWLTVCNSFAGSASASFT